MNKKKISNIVLLIFLFIVALACSKTIYKGSWQEKDFSKISSAEWVEPLRFYDSKSHLQYSVSNDLNNLYLCIKATDEQSQFKILKAGMQVWIDTLEQKKPQVGIYFPQIKRYSPETEPLEKKFGQKHDVTQQKKLFLAEYKEIKIAGFKPFVGNNLPLHNDFRISVDISWDSLNIMYCKAILPFKTFYKESLSEKDSVKAFNFSIIVNAIQMPEKKEHHGDESSDGMSGGGSFGGGMSGGMYGGGPGGGGMHGGHHGGGGKDDRDAESESTNIKFKINLATNQKSSK
jgi:hypothetical protein